MNAQAPVLTLLGRNGCHLCDDMRTVLNQWAVGFSFSVSEIDISGNPELEARYGWDIPVLLAGETEICRHFLDQAALRRWLAAS